MLDNDNHSICKKCTGEYRLNYEYNYTAIFDSINDSSNKEEMMELLYFATENSEAINLLTNSDFKILMSNTIVLNAIYNQISVSNKADIQSINDTSSMNLVFTSS